MFEKDADIILSAHCDCELLTECLQGIRNRCSDYEEKKKLLLEGIEFGYQKANEWHDLRKNPNDLPKEKVDVYVLCAWGEVAVMHLEWNKEWFDDYGMHCSLTFVTHWKEIVLPEETESC